MDLLNMFIEDEVSLYMVEKTDLDKLESIAFSLAKTTANGSQAIDIAMIINKARSLNVTVPGVL